MILIPKEIRGRGGIASIYSYNGKLLKEVFFKPKQMLLDLSYKKEGLKPVVVKFRLSL